MKNTLSVILTITFLAACSNTKETESNDLATTKTEEAQRFDWLIGNWIRLNEEDSKTTYEKWILITPFHYLGEGYTIDKNTADTLFSERMHLMFKDDTWRLGVFTPNDIDTTYFELTTYNLSSFSSFNAVNEFPKTIAYQLDADTLKATISDSSTAIPFIFVRNR